MKTSLIGTNACCSEHSADLAALDQLKKFAVALATGK